MAYAPLTKIPQQFFNNLGNPLVGGTISAFLAGTSTPTNMFSDNAGTVAGTTVILDSRGEPTTFKLIWVSTTVIYKFVLKDSTGTTIWTIDNISGDDGTGNSASSVFDQQTLTATAGQTLFTLGYSYVTGTNAMAVYKNGSRLITGTDFTETSSTSVTLTMAAIAGDEYTFIGGQDVSSSFSSTNVSFIQAGTGAVTRSVQTKLRETVSVKDFGAVGDGVTDDTAAIQLALNSGAKFVYAPNASYKITSSLSIPSGVTLKGDGKSATTLVCSADFTPIVMQNVNDAGIEGVLIIASASQTAAIILLSASTQTITRCVVRDVQCSGNTTDFPFILLFTSSGAHGNWAHLIDDVSVSGCGTVFKAETTSVNSWINSICARHVYANDFIRGIQLIETLGDGASDCTFFDWATQTSARTQYGVLINNASVAGKNKGNSFTDCRFYDLIPPALEYYIGSNVIDTTIQGLSVDALIPSRIEDNGYNTTVKGMSFPDFFTYNGRFVNQPTSAGFTQDVAGTGSTQQLVPYFQLRTGANAGSLARLYTTQTISGLSQNQLFNIDFGLPLKMTFLLTRITAGASSIGRVQLKTTQADGSLAAAGIGIQINNYAVFGESYGSALGTVNLGLTLNDAETYRIDIVHYPALRIEWWVNGELASKQTTVANIPSGIFACYIQNSLSNVAANDVQMFISGLQFKTPNS